MNARRRAPEPIIEEVIFDPHRISGSQPPDKISGRVGHSDRAVIARFASLANIPRLGRAQLMFQAVHRLPPP